MVGADKLQRVHESLSNMSYKNKGMPFGGVSLICFGDLKQVSVPIKNAHVKKYSFQLPPVKDRPIFKSAKIHGRLKVFNYNENLFYLCLF